MKPNVLGNTVVSTLFKLAVALIPMFSGILFQSVDFPFFGRLENLFWGIAFGFGWYVAGVLIGYSTWVSLFGYLVWPTVLCIMLYQMGGYFWKRRHERRTMLYVGLYICTFFVVVPWTRDVNSPISHIPTFTNILNDIFD